MSLHHPRLIWAGATFEDVELAVGGLQLLYEGDVRICEFQVLYRSQMQDGWLLDEQLNPTAEPRMREVWPLLPGARLRFAPEGDRRHDAQAYDVLKADPRFAGWTDQAA